MSELTTTAAPPAGGPAAWMASARRARALAGAELRLLWRNRTAMFTALALPIAMVALLGNIGVDQYTGMGVGTVLVTIMIGFVLLFVVYYNLVTAYVARREELVLKRLRVGEATDAEILAGTALPSLAVAFAQIVLVTAGVAIVVGIEAPVNVLLALLGFVLGVVVFVLLAGASTAFTRNVEMAQVSTLPVLMVCMVLSGMLTPVHELPDWLADVARFLPMTPVIDLTNLGLAGLAPDGTSVDFAESFGAAALPTAVAIGWIVVGAWALRRWFRWEPRG
ncbi:ABC-2 type transport system permease protein [Haloactinopolyspora alba]|uniref:ABC-2 type transport system permease protein n=1 Tax=Haloactinopolyspora alba TaxID=648780 RepID=A0A2P8E2A8_9ACTN|nr:ABC transporter permease [Haloactinopolyspora alba]PSL03605.1 ABC-2 type transport system permease protein [Haloactinopolyspora alba]